MIQLKSYSAQSHQGPYLQTNEDLIDIDLNQKLYLVFDGFGGAGIGDLVVDQLKDNIKKFYTKVGGDPDSTLPFSYSHKFSLEGNALNNSIQFAHHLLKEENGAKAMNNRGGSSLVAISESENLLNIASCGNLMALYHSRGEISFISEPDDYRLLSADNYIRHFQTAPLSGLGLFDDIHLKLKEVRPSLGGQVIILTDGVYARLEAHEIKHILQNESGNLREKIDEMFELSNSRGNLDNQSALILNY